MNSARIDWLGSTFNQIPNHDGYYASKNGQILSTKKEKTILMKQITSKDGYKYVFMYDNGKMEKVWVHQAVLMAWDRMPKDGEETRHLNDIPDDNRLENLCWGTRLENVADKIRNGGIPIGERSGSHKLTEAQVLEIREKFYGDKSSSDLSEEYGLSKNAILRIVNGKTWKHLPVNKAKHHSSRRKTPISEEQIKIGTIALNKYAKERRKQREIVYCACGCGRTLETPDNKGRDRKYIHGHNATGKHWRWNSAEN